VHVCIFIHIASRDSVAEISEISVLSNIIDHKITNIDYKSIVNILSSPYKLHIVFSILTKCEFSGHISLQTVFNVKCHVNPSSVFWVSWDGQMEGGL